MSFTKDTFTHFWSKITELVNSKVSQVQTAIDDIKENYATKTEVGENSVGKFYTEEDGSVGEIFNNYTNNIASGTYSHAEGSSTTASGYYSHAEGSRTTASGSSSHAEGGGTTASDMYSHAEGAGTTASGSYSHAEGGGTTASGERSHAEGYSTEASGNYSHAEGGATTASGSYSHAEGSSATASGEGSHAEGYDTTASGNYSHAEGFRTEASGERSHAEGDVTTASGNWSHAQGHYTIANSNYQTVMGKYNTKDTPDEDGIGKYALIIGNGTDFDARSNCFAVDWEGNIITPTGTISMDLINSIASNVALNTCSIGISKKNLLNYDEYMSKISNANIYHGTIVKNADSFTLTANADDCYIEHSIYTIPVSPNTQYILSWSADSDIDGYIYVFRNGDISARQSICNSKAKQLIITTKSDTNYISIRFGVQNSGDSITYSQIMLRYADITDGTYESYTPNLYEQINDIQSDIADTGWIAIDNPDTAVYSTWKCAYRRVGALVNLHILAQFAVNQSFDTSGGYKILSLPSNIIPKMANTDATRRMMGYIHSTETPLSRDVVPLRVNDIGEFFVSSSSAETKLSANNVLYGDIMYMI